MQEILTDKHILFLPLWYPNRYDPMFGLFIRNHAQLVSGFARVSVVYVHADKMLKRKPECIFIDDAGVQTWIVYFRVVKCKIPGLRECLKLYRFLMANRAGIRYASNHSGKPALIHVHVLTRLGVIALWYKWIHRIPFVITEHWSRYLPTVGTYQGTIRKLLTRLVVRNAKAITTPTRNLRDAMVKHGLSNPGYSILPNLVDTGLFVPGPPLPAASDRVKTIVHVSCFEDRSKNISGLLKSLGQLSGIRSDFKCIFVGDGMDYEDMEHMAEEAGLLNKIAFFAGLLEGEDLVVCLQSSDFMVVSSHYENLPVVISEAFACGLPVLSTDVGGISEILDDERGKLVPANDGAALLNGLIYMMDHLQDFDRNKIRKFAVDHSGKEVVSQTLKKLYIHSLYK
jgi:glycosyltransferase involved in cell wall biosynthesis